MNYCEHCGTSTQPIKLDVQWCPSCGCVSCSHGTFGRTFSAQPAIVNTVATVLDLLKEAEQRKKGYEEVLEDWQSRTLGHSVPMNEQRLLAVIIGETQKETAIRQLLLRYRGLYPPAELAGTDDPPKDGLS